MNKSVIKDHGLPAHGI